MTSVLADTQTVIWYLHNQTKLSPVTLQALNAAARDHRLFVSAITLVEIRLARLLPILMAARGEVAWGY